MSSMYGDCLKVSIWGQSHSEAIGVTIDGFPAGFAIDFEQLSSFLERRAPGRDKYSTQRKEEDAPRFLSGLVGNKTCGAPITAAIFNKDTRSADYNNIRDIPRPSHADYTAFVKYKGASDVNGGGHFSGRLTAPLCIAGGICKQLLEKNGIKTNASIVSIGGVSGTEEKMLEKIDSARMAADSVGGIIECTVDGIPAGIGDPMFDGMENRISRAVFAIPAVRGIEFGRGFAAASMKGSEHNDEFYVSDGKIMTRTNNHGGILGGITSGMPVVFRVPFKPTPSIGIEQKSVSLSEMRGASLTIKGRHDPCIVRRAVPCVEAAAAIAVLDAMLCDGYPVKIDK